MDMYRTRRTLSSRSERANRQQCCGAAAMNSSWGEPAVAESDILVFLVNIPGILNDEIARTAAAARAPVAAFSAAYLLP